MFYTSSSLLQRCVYGFSLSLLSVGFFAVLLTAQVAPKVAVGASHTLMLQASGTVLACGENNFGQLGNGTTQSTGIPIQVSGVQNALDVAVGNLHSVILRSDGTVLVFGRGMSGQLGLGNFNSLLVATTIPGITAAVAVAASGAHTLVLLNNGTVWSFGDNSYGQLGLGNGSASSVSAPTQVALPAAAISICAGEGYSIFILASGLVVACGSNSYGQLGDGTFISRSAPVPMWGALGVTSAAASYSTTYLLTGSTVMGTGSSGVGQLGGAVAVGGVTAWPTVIPGLGSVQSMCAGNNFGLFGLSSGGALALGASGAGQLGTGSTINATSNPTPVLIYTSIVAMDAGATCSVMLGVDGVVYGTGYNNYGQLGLPAGTHIVPTPSAQWCSSGSSFALNFVRYGTNQLGMVLECGAPSTASMMYATLHAWGPNTPVAGGLNVLGMWMTPAEWDFNLALFTSGFPMTRGILSANGGTVASITGFFGALSGITLRGVSVVFNPFMQVISATPMESFTF
ncbi:MAG: hypothetical protein EXS14_07170 [Planctomycetes bacterium]|nr:hypothetical protein [Planctomycetota bacterium]